ncbi:DUF262 domain-containing protein [Bifidobacterium sp. ESL0704]|uniref:DUF262 domain-containing protein n=1 Tax=Bifidobacterium sp. ESL0704 TaxID=2983219 RepID=UPI0023F90497|nr:DUF262 domain-containing protein [Bifidobacterium sp. ESL0704]WEV52234.1 DUF262 domain-containing protein [Bifidobacterium sp. ESL0704]
MTEQSSDKICMKSIQDLNYGNEGHAYHFVVPSYQRGYRWAKSEIFALMDDLSQYFKGSDQRYCLQPIAVRRIDDETYEVIDGQQRLTTLYILGQYCDPTNRGAKYTLQYVTRSQSQEFLQSLNTDGATRKQLKQDNPDFYFMSNAFDCISTWVQNHNKNKMDLCNFWHAVVKNVTVIWYEVPSKTDPIDLFRKINEGKIPLTNAELIKALLLSNQEINNRREATAVALEWDNIEQRLQNDEFWYFLINDDRNSYPTRIDLIFDIWAKAAPITYSDRPYTVFDYVYNESNRSDSKESFVRTMWHSCKTIFANLEYWYRTDDLYHLIGYLVACRGTENRRIIELYEQLAELDKPEMVDYLKEKIRGTLHFSQTPEIEGDDWLSPIEELEYGDSKNSNSDIIRNVLLLFNLLTINNTISSRTRFPFDLYKKEHWDIEHIHALAGGPPTDEEISKNSGKDNVDFAKSRQHFFEDLEKLIATTSTNSATHNQTGGSRNQTGGSRNQTGGSRNQTAIKIIKEFVKKSDFSEEKCHDFWEENGSQLQSILIDGNENNISNTALLSATINRGYQNASFVMKRRWIIAADRKTEFVPPCTKNVFLKYYSDPPDNFSIWSAQDREQYLHGPYGIISTFKAFFGTKNNKEDYKE